MFVVAIEREGDQAPGEYPGEIPVHPYAPYQQQDQAKAEREGRDSVNWNRLIEQARQERLGRIDAEAEAIENEANPVD
jgi:hypothetical protein